MLYFTNLLSIDHMNFQEGWMELLDLFITKEHFFFEECGPQTFLHEGFEKLIIVPNLDICIFE